MIGVQHVALAIGIPLIATQLLTPLVAGVARRLEVVDVPDGERRVHTTTVPRVGGVAVIGALALAMVALRSVLGEHAGLDGVMAGTLVVALVGVVDDVRGVSPRTKVLGQIVAACVAWYFSPQFSSIAVGYGSEFSVGPFALPLLLLWVVVVSNGYNLIDGINGLASSVGIVASLAAAAIAVALGNHAEALVSVSLAASLAGFLRFNFPNARIFLGDSGSLAIGFLLAMLTIRGAARPNGAVVLVVPLLALLVPLFETTLTIVRRWLRSVSVLAADAHHIHHRLLAMGFAHRDATLVLAVAAAIFASLGVGLGIAGPTLAWVISVLVIGALVLALLLAVSVLSYHELAIAGEVLATGPARARRVIRDQISATDLGKRLGGCSTLVELRDEIEASASQFGFARMTLLMTGEDSVPSDPPGRVWRLDYPLETPAGLPPFLGFSLCVLCAAGQKSRPYGAERVIRLLGPVVERWLAEHAEGIVFQLEGRMHRQGNRRAMSGGD